MARPRNADGQRTRQAILDAALDLFADKGYFGTSLRDVATVVGVRESALYNYFTGKAALFDALLDAHQATKNERLAPLADGPIQDGRTLLLQLAQSTLDSYAEPREEKLFRILMSDGIRLAKDGRLNLHERMGHGRESMHAIMSRLIREGWLRKADVNTLSLAFLSPLIVWRQLHAIDASLPMIQHPRAFARRHVDQFLHGAGSGRATPALPARAVLRRKAS